MGNERTVNVGQVVNNEMNHCTGAIIKVLFESDISPTKEEAVELIGNILHDSKRRMVGLFGGGKNDQGFDTRGNRSVRGIDNQ